MTEVGRMLLADEGTHDRLVLNALAEFLRGDDGVFLAQLRAAQISREERYRQLTAKRWFSLDNASGRRRDGAELSANLAFLPTHLRQPEAEVPGWLVSFPPEPGGGMPWEVIRAPTLVDAMEEVDRRWPMPDWWLGLQWIDARTLFPVEGSDAKLG